MRRGALELSMLGMTILTMAAAVVGVIILTVIMLSGEERFTEEQCRISLIGSNTDVRGPMCTELVPSPIPIACNRDYYLIDKGKVLVNGRDATTSFTARCNDGTASCLPYRVLAEAERRCMRQFMGGDTVVFQKLEMNSFSGTFVDITKLSFLGGKTPNACFVCAEFLTNDGALTGYAQYKKDTPMQDHKDTYYLYLNSQTYCSQKYLTGGACSEEYACVREGEDSEGNKVTIEQATKTIDAKRPYAVVFIREGFTTCDNKNPGDKDHPTLTTQVIPLDQIAMHCDTVLV
jgi:hypothetical protein